jgi:hypothetical protein
MEITVPVLFYCVCGKGSVRTTCAVLAVVVAVKARVL